MDQYLTLDQKLKAFEIAARIFPLKLSDENAAQEDFNRSMDEYVSSVAGLAALIIRHADRLRC